MAGTVVGIVSLKLYLFIDLLKNLSIIPLGIFLVRYLVICFCNKNSIYQTFECTHPSTFLNYFYHSEW